MKYFTTMKSARAMARRFVKSERAGVQLLTGLAMPLIIGFSGMGIDTANWLAQKRLTQNIADSAAVAATHASVDLQNNVPGTGTLYDNALQEAVRIGYEDLASNSFVVNPLNQAPVNGIMPRAEVEVVRTIQPYFAGLFLDAAPQVAARAVGGTREIGANCVIGLDPEAQKTVYFTGNSTTTVDCGVTSNSISAQSLVVDGSAILQANPAQAHGDIVIKGAGQIVSDMPLMPHHPRTPDPLSGRTLTENTLSGCEMGALDVQPSDYIYLEASPGCDHVQINGDVHVQGDLDLAPGTYYIHDGDLQVNAQAYLTCSTCGYGDGVTLVLKGTSGSSIGDVRINGGAIVDLIAPSSGDYAGIVIYKSATAVGDGDNKLNGGSTMNIQGAVYMPSQIMEYVGGADVDGCTYLIGRRIIFSGNETTYVHADETECNGIGLDDVMQASQQRIVVLLE